VPPIPQTLPRPVAPGKPCALRRHLARAAGACLLALTVPVLSAGNAPPPLDSWQDAIRQTPYADSQGVHRNLATIRLWVLEGTSYCAEASRHIFFDRRARFLGYMSDVDTREGNQARINARRRAMATNGVSSGWTRGQADRIGYPFVLSCNQPDAQLAVGVARYTGEDATARLWGTWDGIRVGSEQEPVSLHTAIRQVYDQRVALGRFGLPETILAGLAGKVIIESGGMADARSRAGALGIMQLSRPVLDDCEIAERFHFHRIAQIDCALRLLEQNHRNLEAPFAARFGHLPERKAQALYAKLLLQAYHGGVGRVSALLDDPDLNGAARYFAEHHARFTAGDIALGMVLHNLGRNRLGFDSLYYVTDVGIATRAACARQDDLPGC